MYALRRSLENGNGRMSLARRTGVCVGEESLGPRLPLINIWNDYYFVECHIYYYLYNFLHKKIYKLINTLKLDKASVLY